MIPAVGERAQLQLVVVEVLGGLVEITAGAFVACCFFNSSEKQTEYGLFDSL